MKVCLLLCRIFVPNISTEYLHLLYHDYAMKVSLLLCGTFLQSICIDSNILYIVVAIH